MLTSLLATSVVFFSIGTTFGGYEPHLPPHIYAGGDVMLSRSVGYKLKKEGQEWITGGYHPFANVRKDSIILLNLESPFSLPDKDENKATFLFGSNPANVGVLQWLGENQTLVVSLANNHIANAGFAGFSLTLDTLDTAGISHIGLSKKERKKFLTLNRSGRLYCIGGYSYDGRSYYDKKTKITWYVNALSDAKKDLPKMLESKCDERIFMMHWGSEYRTEPSQSQVKLAHTLIDSGATLIIGSHSHIFGKVEQYKGRQIFYSLGNFIFDQDWGSKSCQKNMDCISDETLNKKTVPTYICTAVGLAYPYSSYTKWQWRIETGKLKK